MIKNIFTTVSVFAFGMLIQPQHAAAGKMQNVKQVTPFIEVNAAVEPNLNIAVTSGTPDFLQFVVPFNRVMSDGVEHAIVPITQKVAGEKIAPEVIEKAGTKMAETAILFDKEGKLKRPENLEEWVFMGSSLGMTYIPTDMDPEDPGHFSTVMMEPAAYKHFRKTGKFEDGTVFAKIIHDSKVGHGGASMDEQIYLEIHVKDKQRYPETGSGFFAWSPGDAEYAEMFPTEMGCVACHKDRAAYDDVFTQFYPTIRKQANEAHKKAKAQAIPAG